MKLVGELNQDQFDNLAKLCFDLARGAFIVALFPISNIPINVPLSILKVLIALLWGLAFTYMGLLLLKLKEKVEK